MDSTELLIKESVLPSALANAALLIAAPSLGCLNVYTNAFTDLCKAYGLLIPDLAHILLYNSMGLSSSSIRSPKTDCIQKLTQVSSDSQEPQSKHVEIKKEPEDFECETVIDNKNPLYNACLYNSHSITQDASLDKYIKNEGTKLELPIDIKLEIPLKRKDKSKLTHTEPITLGTSLEIHGKNKDKQLDASFDRKNEGQYKILNLQENNVFDYISSANTYHYSTLIKNNTQSLTSSTSSKTSSDSFMLGPTTSVSTTIDSTGRKQSTSSSKKKLNTSKKTTPSHKKSRKLMKDIQWENPFDRALDKTSKVSIKDQNRASSHGSLQKITVTNEDQPKISSFQKEATTENKILALSNHYSTKFSDNTKLMTSSKSSEIKYNASMVSPTTSVYSILDNTGFRQYATSNEEARKIMSRCGMPMKFANGTICSKDIKDCLVHVDTSMEGSIRTSMLRIWLKDEGRDFMIPFANIHEISKYNLFSVKVYYYYSTQTKSIEHIYLRPQATKSYTTNINIATTINWLQTFLG